MILSIRTATPDDRKALSALFHHAEYLHRHLDWKPALDWLGSQPYWVSERDGQLTAALAFPPDPPETAWLRVFAVHPSLEPGQVWPALWEAAADALQGLCIRPHLAAMPMQPWLIPLLEGSGFRRTHEVILLEWTPRPLPAWIAAAGDRSTPRVVIRPMMADDLPAVAAIDQRAFGPIWRNSLDALRLAFDQSSIATLAEVAQKPAGYQISTGFTGGGHLARLAVEPNLQGQGIGKNLVQNLLQEFRTKGAFRVTVNTQGDNAASLKLYRQLGFTPTGESFPVYEHGANEMDNLQ